MTNVIFVHVYLYYIDECELAVSFLRAIVRVLKEAENPEIENKRRRKMLEIETSNDKKQVSRVNSPTYGTTNAIEIHHKFIGSLDKVDDVSDMKPLQIKLSEINIFDIQIKEKVISDDKGDADDVSSVGMDFDERSLDEYREKNVLPNDLRHRVDVVPGAENVFEESNHELIDGGLKFNGNRSVVSENKSDISIGVLDNVLSKSIEGSEVKTDKSGSKDNVIIDEGSSLEKSLSKDETMGNNNHVSNDNNNVIPKIEEVDHTVLHTSNWPGYSKTILDKSDYEDIDVERKRPLEIRRLTNPDLNVPEEVM